MNLKYGGRNLLVSFSGQAMKFDLIFIKTPGFRHAKPGIDRHLINGRIGYINFDG